MEKIQWDLEIVLWHYIRICMNAWGCPIMFIYIFQIGIQELTAHPLNKYKFRPLSKLLTLLIHAYTLINILLKFGLY